jgi:hypothetical protein
MLGAFPLSKTLLYIIIPVLIISLIFNGIQYSNNKAYEAYLSQELNNMVSHLSSSILKNEQILLEVVDQKQLTKKQAENLYLNYRTIGIQHQELLFLGKNTNKISSGEILNRPATELMPQLRSYFEEFFDNNDDATSIYTLSETDIKNIENITAMSEAVANAVRRFIPGATTDGMTSDYWNDPKVNNSLNHNYWIKVLQEIDRYSFHTLVYY